MSESVKPRRQYNSSRRQEHAAQTRRDILAAAGTLLRQNGYAATSIPRIAAEAGVVVETIYRAFGSKAGLFRAVVEAAVAGGSSRADVPVEERPAIRAIIDEPDSRRKLALYAATQPGIHRRSGPLLRALLGGAALDSELRVLWDEIESRRLEGLGRLAGMLGEQGRLRPGISVERARDLIWTLCSLAVHDLFVVSRGWTDEQYQDWLTEALVNELLPPV